MQLPQILQAWRGVEDLHGVRLAALPCTVVPTATRGASACTSTSELEIGWPWCETTKRSTVPRRFVGHIRSNSLFHVRSPRCAARKLPNVTMLPTDCAFSVLSTSCGLKAAQYGFGLPAPGSDVFIGTPADW